MSSARATIGSGRRLSAVTVSLSGKASADDDRSPAALGDLTVLSDLRERRRRLTADLASGRVPFVDTISAVTSPFLRDTRIVKVLERHPGLGKVAARRLLADLGLDERVTLGGLSDDASRRIEEHLGMHATGAGR